MTIESHALATIDMGSPLPVFSGKQMQQAFVAYKELQVALDMANPEAIMELDGKKFRKKAYWLAVSVAFGLNTELVEERKEFSGIFKDGRDNFGYVVTYRATAPGGRSQTGDGACFAVEKAPKFKCPHKDPSRGGKWTLHFPARQCPDYIPGFQWLELPAEASEHNVRSHAHTRARNRAISNLVAFGEITAEEVDADGETGKTAIQGQIKQGNEDRNEQARQSDATRTDGATKVASITPKHGKSARGPWTMFIIAFADGRSGVTFDTKFRDEAQTALDSGALVIPTLVETTKNGKKGFNLEDLQPPIHNPAEPALPMEPDEPVSEPEKILTIRTAKTAKGERWVIQTDKREMITADKAVADEIERCRAGNIKITPQFETVTSGDKSVNRLLEFSIHPVAEVVK